MKRAANTVIPSRDEKRMRFEDAIGRNWFDALSDDLIISILSKLSASAKSVSDLIGLMSRCDLYPLLIPPTHLKYSFIFLLLEKFPG